MTILVSSYPPYQRQGDYDFYLAALIEICTGIPLATLEAMVHPKTGLTRRLKWLPSLSEVQEFFEKRNRQFSVTAGAPLNPIHHDKFYDRNGKLIPGKKFTEPVTKEEREAHADMLTDLASEIRKAFRATQRAAGGSNGFPQVHEPEKLTAALEALEASQPLSMRGED